MAARTKKIRHDEETRAKIQAAQIINRFHACLMGEVQLDAQQVSVGKALLNKVLPDLSSASNENHTTLETGDTLAALIKQMWEGKGQSLARHNQPDLASE